MKFTPGQSIVLNKRSYTVVLDRVVSELKVDDSSEFVIGTITVSKDIKFYCIITYDSIIGIKNPIGFWHTLFLNLKFDYSKDFYLKVLSASDEQSFFVDFIFNEKNSVISTAIFGKEESKYQELVFKTSELTKTSIIKTRQQIHKEKKRYLIKTAIKNTVAIALVIAVTAFYFQYKKAIFDNANKELILLIAQKNILEKQLNNAKELTIKKDLYSITHIRNITALSQIIALDGEIDLTINKASVSIQADQIDMAYYILNDIKALSLTIERKFKKDIGVVSWVAK